jgi:hypothetical protein
VVFACLAHVGPAHLTWRTLAASTPYGKHAEVARFHARDRSAYRYHLAKHLVTDDEFFLAIGSIRTSTGYFFPVGAADAHAYHAELDLILRGDGWLWPVN